MKHYSGLTLNSLKTLVAQMISLDHLKKDWEAGSDKNIDRLWGILGSDYYWSQIYTFPLQEHIGMFSMAAGLDEILVASHSAIDQPEAIPHMLRQLQVDGLDESITVPDDAGKQALTLWFGLLKTLDSISHYGVPLDLLVRRCANGDATAFFKAVRIDRSILSCPPFADRLARAEIEQDEPFFHRLGLALKGKSKKPKDEFGLLRYILLLLNSDGSLEQMTMEERYELICIDLGLYPADSEDPARSLQTFIQRWRKTQ